MPQNGEKGKGTNSVDDGVLLSYLTRYSPCASSIAIISPETWCCACALLAIDIQPVERFMIFSDIADKEHHGVREGVPL